MLNSLQSCALPFPPEGALLFQKPRNIFGKLARPDLEIKWQEDLGQNVKYHELNFNTCMSSVGFSDDENFPPLSLVLGFVCVLRHSSRRGKATYIWLLVWLF